MTAPLPGLPLPPGSPPGIPLNPNGSQIIPQPMLVSPPAAPADGSPTPHLTLLTLVGEVVFVAVLAMAADAGPKAETVVMTLLIGLWLAFLVSYAPKLMSMIQPRR